MLSYESYFLIMLISILGPVLCVVVMFFYHILEKQTNILEMQNREIKLEKELEIRRFMQLQQQIQPHFLFNALNSLFSLLRLKKYDELSESFEYIIIHLRALYEKDKDTHSTIADEIAHTENYLNIQKLRFNSRLQVTWDIDERIMYFSIVRFMLQTLVENSFKHGLEQVERDFHLKIQMKQIEIETLELIVTDNGPGFLENPFIYSSGVGLENIKKQLEYLYDNDANINIRVNNHTETGAKVTIHWPIRNM